jgi:DNA-binding SARP family transcriptional activator
LETCWRIQLFGGLRAIRDDQIVSHFRTHKTAALLAYLAFYSHRSHPREELIELLWPECDPPLGRRSLRTALSSLRHQLEPPGIPPGAVILADRRTVWLDPRTCETDVAQFEAALALAEGAPTDRERIQPLTRAAGLYGGELLPGFFDEWIRLERQRLAEAFLQALLQLAALLERSGDLPQAVRWAQRAVAADPLCEESHQALIRLLISTGQEEAARRQFAELERLLAEELSTSPSRGIRSLLEDSACVSSPSPRGHGQFATAPQPGALPDGVGSQRSPHPPVGFLPRSLTRLLGREAEVAELKRHLSDPEVALVTLTGAGGIGKTHLALQAAEEMIGEFPDGVFFVDLAPLRDLSLVPSAIAQALGVRETGGRPLLESLRAHLRSKQVLLLLDNFEHLLATAPLVTDLLSCCPRLKVLATSRATLHLRGEHPFPVPPLALPDRQRMQPAR